MGQIPWDLHENVLHTADFIYIHLLLKEIITNVQVKNCSSEIIVIYVSDDLTTNLQYNKFMEASLTDFALILYKTHFHCSANQIFPW